MAPDTHDQRLELLQSTLDRLILQTLQWGRRPGDGIGQTIRVQSEDLLKLETKATKAFCDRMPEQVSGAAFTIAAEQIGSGCV